MVLACFEVMLVRMSEIHAKKGRTLTEAEVAAFRSVQWEIAYDDVVKEMVEQHASAAEMTAPPPPAEPVTEAQGLCPASPAAIADEADQSAGGSSGPEQRRPTSGSNRAAAQLVGAELMKMYFKYSRIQLRCHPQRPPWRVPLKPPQKPPL